MFRGGFSYVGAGTGTAYDAFRILEIVLAERIVFVIEEIVLFLFDLSRILFIVDEEAVAEQIVVVLFVDHLVVIVEVAHVRCVVIVFKTDILVIVRIIEVAILFFIQLVVVEVFHRTIPFQASSPSTYDFVSNIR